MSSEKKKRIQKWKDIICNTDDRMYQYDGYDCKGRGIDGKKRPSGAITIAQHNKFIKKKMYGSCRCKDTTDHSCGWVTLLDSYNGKSIVSRSWPIKYGLYNLVTHTLLQDYILPDYTYDLIEFENKKINLNLNQIQNDIVDNKNINLLDINNLIHKLQKYEQFLKKKEEKIDNIIFELNKKELKLHFQSLNNYESNL